tara:strand:+ start:461 stop:2005 length:1545 start_codon:yes stop_codon:yes gene_type:complete
MHSLPGRGALFDRAACALLGSDRFPMAQYDELVNEIEGGVARHEVLRVMEEEVVKRKLSVASSEDADAVTDEAAGSNSGETEAVWPFDVGSALRVEMLDVDAHVIISPKRYVVRCVARAMHEGCRYVQLRFVEDNTVVARKLRDVRHACLSEAALDTIVAAREAERVAVAEAKIEDAPSPVKNGKRGGKQKQPLSAPRKLSYEERKAKAARKSLRFSRAKVVAKQEDSGSRWAQIAREAAPPGEGDAAFAEIMAVDEPDFPFWLRIPEAERATPSGQWWSRRNGKVGVTNTPRRKMKFELMTTRPTWEREAERRARVARVVKVRRTGWQVNSGLPMRWYWEEKRLPTAEDDAAAIKRFRKRAYASPSIASVNALLLEHVGANAQSIRMSKKAAKAERYGDASVSLFHRRYALPHRCARGCNLVAPVLKAGGRTTLPRRRFESSVVHGHVYAFPGDVDAAPLLTQCPIGVVMNALVSAFIRNPPSAPRKLSGRNTAEKALRAAHLAADAAAKTKT